MATFNMPFSMVKVILYISQMMACNLHALLFTGKPLHNRGQKQI